MDPITQQTILASAGGKKDQVYVDDVFSTFLYPGNGTAQPINNGIDLAGEGGMVWVKNRKSQHYDHQIVDTERGNQYNLRPDRDLGQNSGSTGITSFNNNGFSVGAAGNFNLNNAEQVSWTFRKAPGFFDVVKYTGTGFTRTVPHNLGSVPGMYWVKKLSGDSWACYHKNVNINYHLRLDETSAQRNQSMWNGTAPTSTEFTVEGSDGAVNADEEEYIAYVFADNDAQFGTDGDESIIKCGSYYGSSSTQRFIDLGFEPQWLLIKCIDGSGGSYDHWAIFDNMRGTVFGGNDLMLAADIKNEEGGTDMYGTQNLIEFNPSGFNIGVASSGYTTVNTNGKEYIYMAIRRPNKPPTAATDVFAIDTGNSSSTIPTYDSGFPVDFAIRLSNPNGGNHPRINTRMLGTGLLTTSNDNAMSSDSASVFDSNVGWSKSYDNTSYSWMFKRAPGFVDVVGYTGNTTQDRQINHSLGVAPELVITKDLDNAEGWGVWSKHADYNSTEHKHGFLGSSNGSATFGNYGGFPNATDQSSYFTSSYFTVRLSDWTNVNNNKFIAYLFASLPGISKVGRYTGNGTSKVIDCGFDAGARFVLIKCMTVTNDWRLFDTVRGINASANDPVIPLNTNASQNTTVDWLRPNSSGFEVNTSNDNVNGNNAEYLFLAIA